MNAIKESDWKRLRQLKPVALDRFCTRILAEVETASSDPGKTPHERYLQVYNLVRDRDRELGRMFDDLKRSNAVAKLMLIRQTGLLTEDELSSFSEEMRSLFAGSQGI